LPRSNKFLLILVRHAKAGPHNQADIERPLIDVGIQDALENGKRLSKEAYNIDLTLCSTSVRTRQTLTELAKSLDCGTVEFSETIYTANTSLDLSRFLKKKTTAAVRSVLLIGHNPTISDFASSLTGEFTSLAPGECHSLSLEAESWDEAISSEGLWRTEKVFKRPSKMS